MIMLGREPIFQGIKQMLDNSSVRMGTAQIWRKISHKIQLTNQEAF